MSKEDEIHDVLSETARGIYQYSTNPRTWLESIVYLLRCLEQKATDENSSHKMLFVDMLSALQDAIRNRLKTGGW
jgi:hypothetical protein